MRRLNGRVEIMRYLSIRSRTTLRKWRRLGPPVYQTPTGRVFAVCEELNAWRRPAGLRTEGKLGHRRGQNAPILSDFIRRKVDAGAAGKTRRG